MRPVRLSDLGSSKGVLDPVLRHAGRFLRRVWLSRVLANPSWYPSVMNAVRGRVRGGHIETEASLPEGAEVVVLTVDNDDAFELDEDQIAELERRMAEADRGELVPADAVFGRLRRAR